MATYRAVEPDELQADRSRSYAEFLRRVSVDIGADHHFVDVTKDPSVLVVFAPD
jgi:hypothetical protein